MLKKTLFILLAVGMLFAGTAAFADGETTTDSSSESTGTEEAAATATPAPLLYNGDMEGVDYDSAENATGTWYWGVLDDGATIAADTDTYYGESGASMKVSGRPSSSSGAMQYVTLTAGTSYDVSAWVKADTAENYTYVLMNNYWQQIECAAVSAEAGTWSEMSGTFTCPSDWGGGYIYIATGSTNDFYIDDVSIKESNNESASEIINTGNMESYGDDKIPYYWGATDKGTSCLPSTEAYSGTYGIKVTGRNPASDGLMEYISLTNEKTYVITAYVKTAEEDTAQIKVRYNYWSDDIAASAETSSTGWTKLTATYTVRSSGEVTQIVINTANTTCDFYVDDVSIIDVDTIVTSESIDLTSGEIVMDVTVDSDVIDTSNISNITTTIGGETPDSNHAVVVSDSATEDSDGNTFYTISQKIMASQMADTLAVTIPLSGGGTYTYTTSVKNYAANVSDLDTNEQTALTAMLDYGSAVQKFNGESTDSNLANSGTYITEFTDSGDDNDFSTLKNSATKTTTTDNDWNGATLKSLSMNLNYNFNLGLTYDASVLDYTVSATLGGSNCTTDSSTFSDSNTIVIEGLTAADFSKNLVVTLEDSSSNKYVITTTPMYFVRLLADSSTTTDITGSTSTLSDTQMKVGKMLYKYLTAVETLVTESSAPTEE